MSNKSWRGINGAKPTDLGMVMELRREKEEMGAMIQQLRNEKEQLRLQAQQLHQQLSATQSQLLVIIHSQPDHSTTVDEEDYAALPDSFAFTQENHPDGSYTVRVIFGDELDERMKDQEQQNDATH